MTDKERIKEMARDIAKKSCYLYDKCPKEPKHNCISQDPEIMLESSKNYVTIATWLVEEGYRKESDTVKEILQKINNNFKCIGGFRYGKVLAKEYGVEIE